MTWWHFLVSFFLLKNIVESTLYKILFPTLKNVYLIFLWQLTLYMHLCEEQHEVPFLLLPNNPVVRVSERSATSSVTSSAVSLGWTLGRAIGCFAGVARGGAFLGPPVPCATLGTAVSAGGVYLCSLSNRVLKQKVF